MPGMGPMGPGSPGGGPGGGPHGGPHGGPRGGGAMMIPGVARTSGFGGYYSRPASAPTDVDNDGIKEKDEKPVENWSKWDDFVHFIRWRWFG